MIMCRYVMTMQSLNSIRQKLTTNTPKQILKKYSLQFYFFDIPVTGIKSSSTKLMWKCKAQWRFIHYFTYIVSKKKLALKGLPKKALSWTGGFTLWQCPFNHNPFDSFSTWVKNSQSTYVLTEEEEQEKGGGWEEEESRELILGIQQPVDHRRVTTGQNTEKEGEFRLSVTKGCCTSSWCEQVELNTGHHSGNVQMCCVKTESEKSQH